MTTDWTAQWVSPTATGDRPGHRPAYRLQGEVAVDRPVRRATLHATAHGIYELELDGARVTADELTPGFTEYASRTQVQTYDVTGLLGVGAHTLGALLADGWYRGQVGITRATDQWGTETAFLAQLELEHEDGTTSVLGTDETWRWSTTHILAADLIEGQREDRRLVGVHDWQPVVGQRPRVRRAGDVTGAAGARRRGAAAGVGDRAPTRRARRRPRPEHQRPGAADERSDPAGTEITLTHGEALGPDGDVTMTHLQPAMPFLPEPLSAGQVDSVVSAGVDGDAFEPRFTTHGFQFVRVEGHPGPLTADDVTGVVVHTDLEERGDFSCDVEVLERLHSAAVWSFRGNACDIPTDCPTRERAGWTGDWQLYIPTASYLYDVRGFSLKWLRDLAVEQWADGNLGNMAPMPVAERTGFLEKMNGSAGWGDAIVLVPWEMYDEYGDTETLDELWPAMVRWLDRVERMASGERHPDRVGDAPGAAAARAVPLGHRLPLGRVARARRRARRLPVVHRRRQVRRRDRVLRLDRRARGPDRDRCSARPRRRRATRCSAPARSTPGAPSSSAPDGRITPHTQANLVRALTFGLVPDEHRQRAADDLAALVREAGTHLGTGFLSTPDLLPVLADHGHLDLAYELLLQDTEPSWLAMIDRGATTVWERWDGIRADGSVHESLNHYSKGAVISFLHRYVAGLQRLEPTWTRFRVAPRPGGGVTRAPTEHVSPHGPIAVAWSAERLGVHPRRRRPARLRRRGRAPAGRTARSRSPSRPAPGAVAALT